MSEPLLNLSQQDITDVGANISYFRINMSNVYVKTSSICNFWGPSLATNFII